jgi:hypothetical protein
MTCHTRASWSAREDRTASALWLGVLWVGMIAGFGVDFPRYLHENPPAPKIIYVHGAVFTMWMLILTAQVLLILRDRVAWHRKLGWFAAGWASLMAVMGPWAAMASYAVNLHNPNNEPQFLSVNIVDIGGFLVLLAWGMSLRKNAAAHKRMMILATVALADPGFSRFSGWLIPAEPSSVGPWFIYVFYGNAFLVLAMAGWDWWRGRLMPQFLIGATALLTAMFIASTVYFWAPWKALSLALVQAWARHFA